MGKKEIFAEILYAVSRETEIAPEQILSYRRDEETMDARYLLVYFLSRQGFTASRIAGWIQRDARTVNNLIAGFAQRRYNRRMFGVNLENIRRQLGINPETTGK